MHVLLFLSLLVGGASAAPEARSACDGLGFVERLACVQTNYPKIHAAVEALCQGLEGRERRDCRAREYEARGISWSRSDEDAGARGAERSADTRRRSSSGGDVGAGVGGGVPSGAGPSPSQGTASQSGSTGTTSAGVRDAGSSGARGGTTGGSTGARGSTGGSASGGSGGSRGGATSVADMKLDGSAASLAAMTLTMAGTAMQQVPTVCPQSPLCGLSRKEQKTVAAFGGVISNKASKIPGILASRSSDAAKATQIAAVLAQIAASVPTGLSPEAQLYVSMGAEALGALSAAIGK